MHPGCAMLTSCSTTFGQRSVVITKLFLLGLKILWNGPAFCLGSENRQERQRRQPNFL